MDWLAQHIVELVTLAAVGYVIFQHQRVKVLETTVSGLNTILAALDKLDLPVWADRFQAHAKITERDAAARIALVKHEAALAIAEVRGQAQHVADVEKVKDDVIEVLVNRFIDPMAGLTLALMAETPASVRLPAIDKAKLPQPVDRQFRRAATLFPEPRSWLSWLLEPGPYVTTTATISMVATPEPPPKKP